MVGQQPGRLGKTKNHDMVKSQLVGSLRRQISLTAVKANAKLLLSRMGRAMWAGGRVRQQREDSGLWPLSGHRAGNGELRPRVLDRGGTSLGEDASGLINMLL